MQKKTQKKNIFLYHSKICKPLAQLIQVYVVIVACPYCDGPTQFR